MSLKKEEPSSGNLMAQTGNHPKPLKSYLSLIYNENTFIFLVSNSDGKCLRSSYGKQL